MLRNCVRVSSRLAISAAISWTLIPIASADAPAPQDKAAASPAASSDSTGEPPTKVLHTVPEDGIGDVKWLSGATRFVRETVAKHPKEDLVICIGGCIPYQQRIVYAQPTEYVPPKPDEQVSDSRPKTPDKIPAAVAAPAKMDDAQSKAKPDAKSAKAPVGDMPMPATNANSAPAAAKAAIGAPAKSNGLEPKSEPKSAVITPAAKSATDPLAKPVTAPVATPATPSAVTPLATPVAAPEMKPVAPAAKSVAIPAAAPAAAAPVVAPSAGPTATAPLASETKPALAPAATAARPEDMKKLEFVPTMADPKAVSPRCGRPNQTAGPSCEAVEAAPAPVVVPK